MLRIPYVFDASSVKEGENKIGNIVIEKIEPEVLCDLEYSVELETKFREFMEGLEEEE